MAESNLTRFRAFAAAFEQAKHSDDWSVLVPFLADDVRYTAEWPAPLGGSFQGRDAVLGYFKRILDGFDRRFAALEMAALAAPREEGDTLRFRGRSCFTAPGRPDLSFESAEVVRFAGGVIVEIADLFDAEARATIAAYLREHGAALGIGVGFD